MENESALKHLLSPMVNDLIAAEVLSVYKKFDLARYKKNTKTLKDLELKPRVLLITQALKMELPTDYLTALAVIQKIIKRKKLNSFQYWPLSEYISQFGLDHFDESMFAMQELTQVFTSEFAIRNFIDRDHQRVLKYFNQWVEHESEHVRRWISEGMRPFLPWAQRVKVLSGQVGMSLPLLERLKFDESLYVRKSIANHLNDISKSEPELVIATLKKWMKVSGPHHDKILWIRNHGLRTLVKKGHPEALKLLGVDMNAEVKISKFKLLTESVLLGEHLDFEFWVSSTSKKAQKIVIDYAIWFVKANGSDRGKVFKLKTFSLAAGESVKISKRHPLRKITTMKFHSGKHYVSIQINGKVLEKTAFDLEI